MGQIIKNKHDHTIWFQKTWHLTHGYGYHIQILLEKTL